MACRLVRRSRLDDVLDGLSWDDGSEDAFADACDKVKPDLESRLQTAFQGWLEAHHLVPELRYYEDIERHLLPLPPADAAEGGA